MGRIKIAEQKKRGAKKKINKVIERIDSIKSWRRNGVTVDKIAENLGIGLSTLWKYASENKDILDALNESKEALDAKIEDVLVTMILDETATKTERLNALKYYESTRTKHMPNDKVEAFRLRARELEQKIRENDIEEQKIIVSELGDAPNE